MSAQGVSVVLKALKGVENARVDTFFAIGWEAEVKGEFIGGFESDTLNVFSEAVGLILKESFGAGAVFFDEADALAGSDAVGLKEDHEVADGDLFLPCGLDGFGALASDAGDFAEATGILADNAEGVGTEVVDDFSGVGFADPVHHSAAKVFADAVNGGGEFRFKLRDFKLVAMAGVAGPLAYQSEGFAALYSGQVSEDGNRRSTLRDGDFRDAVSIFFVEKDNAL